MTKKMPALFKKVPPKAPLTSLKAVVDDWIFRFGEAGHEKHRRDTVCEYCAQSPDVQTAIRRACASRAANGKMHNHQSRVPEFVRKKFASIIIGRWKAPANFDELHDSLVSLAPAGIGPVTIYDVATRIAAYLSMDVCSLYLHAGVKEGWQILTGEKEKRERIPRSELPAELRRLPTDEVEDLLCCYRETLRPWLKKPELVNRQRGTGSSPRSSAN